MWVLVAVLALTTLAATGALAWQRLQPPEHPGPDEQVAAVLDRSPAPATVRGTRRIITIEVLNPIELAGTRGRLAGLAGAIVPGLTRRIVHDQVLTLLKQQLAEQQVVADVRLHTLRAPDAAATEDVAAPVVDQVQDVDLAAVTDPAPADEPTD